MSTWKPWESLSQLARLELERLRSEGLAEADRDRETVSKQVKWPYVRNEPSERARPVRLGHGQVVWLEPGGAIEDPDQGYRCVKVFDRPSKPDTATIAALTASMAAVVEPPETVRKAVPLAERWREERSRRGDWAQTRRMGEMLEVLEEILREPQFAGLAESDLKYGTHPAAELHFEYVKDLLRHYRPGFDDLPHGERIALIEHTCRYVNAFLEALRKLVQFAEYGSPRGTISPAVKKAARDVRVAELHDVAGLKYRKIAELIGEPPPKTWLSKNDHPKVRKMGDRGRDILERAFGKVGWRELAEARREEAVRYKALPEWGRWLERMATIGTDFQGVPLEEARVFVTRYVERRAAELGVSFEEAAQLWAEKETLEGPNEFFSG